MNVINSTSCNPRLKKCSYILTFLSLDVFFCSFLLTVLRNTRCPLSFFSNLIVSSFLLETSSEKMSSFVNLILRGHSGGRCHSLPRCRDRPMCNSRFLGSGSLLPRPIPSLNVLIDISCLLNYYLIKRTINSLHYSFSSLFEFSGHDKYLCFVLSLSSSISSLLTYFRFFLMVFLF